MFTFEVNKNEIKMTESETVTSGSVNVYLCQFTFSEDWEGLAKTITFRAGDVSVSVLLDSTNICSIPWEVLEKDAVQLYAGVRGTVTDTDTEEEAVIPTVYCLLGTIRKGTELGDNARPPEPSIVDQIMNRIETLDEEKQDKLTGLPGQVVSFDELGNVIAREEKGTEYKAGENISISADNTISAKIYDDTAIRGEISNVKSKTEANSTNIAKNTADINTNAEAIAENTSGIASNAANISANTANIAKNTEAIAKNAGDVKTVSDRVDTLTSSFSTLSSSVTNNAEAISKANSDISTLSSSVTAAEALISKNTTDISSANSEIAGLSESKQDKLTGLPGQVVSFDELGNVIAREEKGTEYKAGENISISADNTISAKMYDDTAIRGEISNVKGKTEANSTNIAKNTADINTNAEAIAKNAGDVKTVSDRVDTLTSSFSTLSSSVTNNAEAISKANSDISTLSSSVTAAEALISKNTTDISSANSEIAGLSESKQDKLTGTKGQVVGFDELGNVIAREEKGTEYKAGENISISADNTISAKIYDDTAIRGEISNVKSKTEANSTNIAKNTADINTNAEAIAENTSGIASNAANISANTANIAKNTADIKTNAEAIAENTSGIASNAANISANTANIAKNTADINTNAEAIAKNAEDVKTVSDRVDTLTSSFSTLSSSVTNNAEAISKANSDISTLSSSVTAAEALISKNTTDISSANSAIAGLSESKQDKLTGTKGQVVGFDDNGNSIAQEYTAGTTYTAGANISISEDNVISATAYDDTAIKSQISSLETNVSNVSSDISILSQRINSKQDKISAGNGIDISGATVSLSNTASTRSLYTYNGTNTGGTTISSMTNFTVTSQTSNLSNVLEYMKLGTGNSIRARYSFMGNLSATIKASVAKTYFSGNPISVTMSKSASFTEFAGFATIIISGTTYLCLVKTGGGKTLTLYPTEEFTISSGASATLGLYL